jgi:hypothetical protein
MIRPPSEAVDLRPPVHAGGPYSYGYLSLWKTVGWWLFTGAAFHSE